MPTEPNSDAEWGPKTGSGRRSKADRAYDELFRMILTCELAPGVWVTVAQLADQLGSGRTPTYEALARLESDGFVRPVKRRGWQVTPLTLHSVNEIIEAYRHLAPELGSLVIRHAGDDELRRLRALTESWNPVQDSPDPDSAPFAYFAEVSGNVLFTKISLVLMAHFERTMNFALLQGSFADEAYVHWRDAVHDALAARDEERMREALDQLTTVGASELNRILLQNGSPQTTSLTIGS